MITILDNNNFQEEVGGADIPVIVDFYADWCMPCKMVTPVLAQLSGEYAGKIKICKINIDINTDLAMEYRVLSIPTLLFFENGQVVGKIEGAETKAVIQNKINKLFKLI